jgi:HTH-type transcriptional regulator/antitoxin HigA
MLDEYEKKHCQIDAPDPIEAIKIRMEDMHLKQVDHVNVIGGKNGVSEVQKPEALTTSGRES